MFHSFCCRRDARISVRVRFVHLQAPRLLNRMRTASAVQQGSSSEGTRPHTTSAGVNRISLERSGRCPRRRWR